MLRIILVLIITCLFLFDSAGQKVSRNAKSNPHKNAQRFPELQFTEIPGAPKLSMPTLIMGETGPVKGEGMGWASPAFWDWNGDGKKDLLIGEFGSGMENKGMHVGNFVRVYSNIGSDKLPAFDDVFNYAYMYLDHAGSYGTPVSVYTWCCMAFTPRFADLDNDGYDDLITGQFNPGYVTWFRGSIDGFLPGQRLIQAGSVEEGFKQRNYLLPSTDTTSSSYWLYSAVDFADIDGDGDFDMIVGGSSLRISENVGTRENPRFGVRKLLHDLDGDRLVVHHITDKERKERYDSREKFASTPEGGDFCMIPTVVDWDRDGVLDLLVTDSYVREGSFAVTFFKGVKTANGLRYEKGKPLFTSKNGGKEFPGYHPNICVTDWNDDGVNDLLIGTAVTMLNGKYDAELSWQWAAESGVYKKNPAYYSSSMKRVIESQLKMAEEYQKKTGLSSADLKKKGYMTKESTISNYYIKESYKNSLFHQGYVYLLLGQ